MTNTYTYNKGDLSLKIIAIKDSADVYAHHFGGMYCYKGTIYQPFCKKTLVKKAKELLPKTDLVRETI
jgi:hypothetical protein|tara:strand:- start:44 stop:247 length:204 start_codon:yes stop_codon:yes gene_type:complete